MAQFDSTYSIDGIDSTLNVSEDGINSITIESDSPEAYNFTVPLSETVIVDNIGGNFKYIMILNLDDQNDLRIRTFLTGDITIDEPLFAGGVMLIPSRQYWGGSTAAAREFVSAESIKAVAAGFPINIKVIFVK